LHQGDRDGSTPTASSPLFSGPIGDMLADPQVAAREMVFEVDALQRAGAVLLGPPG